MDDRRFDDLTKRLGQGANRRQVIKGFGASVLGVIGVASGRQLAAAQPAEKITICHATGSATNPYVEITVSKNALRGHERHDGDIIPAPPGGCPGPKPEPDKCYGECNKWKPCPKGCVCTKVGWHNHKPVYECRPEKKY